MTRTLILTQMNGHKTLVAMDKVVAIRDCEWPTAKKNKYYGELVFENKEETQAVKETVGQIDVMLTKVFTDEE
jgi:hypothetical protein